MIASVPEVSWTIFTIEEERSDRIQVVWILHVNRYMYRHVSNYNHLTKCDEWCDGYYGIGILLYRTPLECSVIV